MAGETGAREGEAPTAFTSILRQLVQSIPGATGAIFTDTDGECVDYFCQGDPFDLKVIGAHGSILMRGLEAGRLAPVATIVISGASRSLWLSNLGEGYTLTLVLDHRTWSGDIERNLESSSDAIRSEAGLG
jgi:predicted regulator of Ras-like GTPase activity (Roadblock/LC7/MglB family)